MAILTATYGSDVMKRQISFRVFLPVDNTIPGSFSYANPPTQKYRTLYMLHGLTNDAAEWLLSSPLKRLAQERNLAVVMPSGENSFYVPGLAPNSDYGQLVGQEIVDMSRRMFPLSTRREDTFIGGVSMGGFGAVRNGLKYAETFSKVLSFSAAIHMFEFEPGDALRPMVCHEDMVMGDFNTARLTDKNPAVCLTELEDRVRAGETAFPEIYMICGTEDGLIDANRSFKEKLERAGVPLCYEEGPGRHDFQFWNQYLPKMLDWMLN